MISGWRVGLALLLPFAVGALQWVLWDPWIKPFSWLLFYPAAFFCAWLGGMAAGIGGMRAFVDRVRREHDAASVTDRISPVTLLVRDAAPRAALGELHLAALAQAAAER